jgi:hypothetical protein
MWAKNANLNGNMTWYQAIYYCNNLILCDYTDWRSPNVNELESLIHPYESKSATWLNSQGFTNVLPYCDYWSSTTIANYPDGAWLVFTEGGPYMADKSDIFYYVWPVRSGQNGGADSTYPANVWKTGQTTSYYTGDDGDLQRGVAWPSPRFADHRNGTVTDTLTGLMWTKDANLPNGTRTWQTAFEYVTSLNDNHYLGYTDWRLPNLKELRSLTDYSKYDQALPEGHPFTDIVDVFYWTFYWTSTSFTYSPDDAWVLPMRDGFWDPSTKSSYNYVWPVRGGTIDSDSDGVSDREEQGANGADLNFDGNGDGVPDRQQNNVTSLHTFDGQQYITLAAPSNTTLANVKTVPVPDGAPSGTEFPYGLFGFTINGLQTSGATTITLYLPSNGPVPDTYYKYGKTPDNTSPHWYEFIYDGQTGAEISGNTIIIHFIDGQRGDNDLTANGSVADPGGPCIKPTLIELISFTATLSNRTVVIKWTTVSEIDNAGFNLYRAESEHGEYVKINTSLIPAEGSPTRGASYQYVDNNVKNRTIYYYRLEDINLNGVASLHGPVSSAPRIIQHVR